MLIAKANQWIAKINPDLFLGISLLLGFVAAVYLRVIIGQPKVAQSQIAGLVFAACLGFMSLAAGIKFELKLKSLMIGIIGGSALSVFPFVNHIISNNQWPSHAGYSSWVLTIMVVVLCEEMFLRGALFQVLLNWRGPIFATIISAIAFAGLHLPMYGWSVLLLDFGVGLFLGWLRLRTGDFNAPFIVHLIADLAGWWLR